MSLVPFVHTDALLINLCTRITASYFHFASLSVDIIKTKKHFCAMFSGRYYDSNYSGNIAIPYAVDDNVARDDRPRVHVYPVANSVFPFNPYGVVPIQSEPRTPTYHDKLLANPFNNHVNYFPTHSPSMYIPLESNIVRDSPRQQNLRFNGYNAGLNRAPTITSPTGFQAGSQPSSYINMSDNALREEIRSSILQQINPRLASNAIVLSETKKRPKRPSSTNEGIGGKKQKFVDNRDRGRKNSPNAASGSSRPQSISPKASSSQTNRKESYHDGGSHFIPDHMLLRMAISPKDPYEKVSRAIINYFLENQQTNEVFERKMNLRDALFSIVQSVFPHSGLYIVGSSMSGFGTKRSDMDMCLMISQQGIDQKKEATDLLYALQRALRKCSFVKNLEVIRAKVPILRFRDKVSDVECDLNVNNLVGIRNTHLLKHYSLSDWRIRPLGLFIKYWARSHNINDARHMTISSYSLALMMIHYLQCGCTPPVLPSLQVKYPHEFNPRTDVRELKPVTFSHQSPNTLSIGELFLGFLEYFSFTFDYRSDAISIRLGKTLAVRDVQKQTSDQGRQWSCLCIEEPFDLTNTARSVYNQQIFLQVQKAFKTSFMKLNKGKDIREVLKQNI